MLALWAFSILIFLTLSETPTVSVANGKQCVALRTSLPAKPAVVARIKFLARSFSQQGYTFFVRADRHNMTVDDLDRAILTWDPVPTSVVSLEDLLSYFPPLRDYLYNESTNFLNTRGSCCGKPDMWQLLVPSDVHFLLTHPECSSVWVIEDDVNVVYHESSNMSRGLLVDKIVDHDQKHKNDEAYAFVYQNRNRCPRYDSRAWAQTAVNTKNRYGLVRDRRQRAVLLPAAMTASTRCCFVRPPAQLCTPKRCQDGACSALSDPRWRECWRWSWVRSAGPG